MWISHLGAGEGLGGCAVLLVRLCCPALFVCAIIFVKLVLSVVATPLPRASGSICLLGLPAPHSAVLGFPRLMPALAARPSQQRPVIQQLPKALVSGGSEVECCSAGGLNPEPWGGGPYMTPPCPPSTRLKAQSSQIGLPLFMCQMAPAACPIPSPEPELLPPSPTVSICPSYVPLCAVTDPAELPVILCSNNGAPPTPSIRAPLGF